MMVFGNTMTSHRCFAFSAVIGLLQLGGCSSSFEQIDHEVDLLVAHTNEQIGGDLRNPRMTDWNLDAVEQQFQTEYDPVAEFIPTLNPYASDLEFIPSAESDAEQVIARLDRYNEKSADATQLDLRDALAYAMKNSREFRFAEEEFVLASLRLLIERHQWGPRFFDEFSTFINGDADDGLYDTSLTGAAHLSKMSQARGRNET